MQTQVANGDRIGGGLIKYWFCGRRSRLVKTCKPGPAPVKEQKTKTFEVITNPLDCNFNPSNKTGGCFFHACKEEADACEAEPDCASTPV